MRKLFALIAPTTMPTSFAPTACPCGGATYAHCCGPFIDGAALAPSAEKLMRSRYTAYTQGNEAYLRATWHPDTCPAGALIDGDETVHWLGLEVKSDLRLRKRQATQDRCQDSDSVEFVARYKIAGRAYRLHEVSRFVRAPGGTGMRWLYLDGSFPQ